MRVRLYSTLALPYAEQRRIVREKLRALGVEECNDLIDEVLVVMWLARERLRIERGAKRAAVRQELGRIAKSAGALSALLGGGKLGDF